MKLTLEARCRWILVLLTAVLFLPSLTTPFIYDDYYHFVENTKLHAPQSVGDVFHNGRQETRPVFNFSLYLQARLFGKSAMAAHAVNITLYLICVLGLFEFLLALSLPWSVSLVSTFLFAIHPINVESVVYFNSRSGLLALTFALWAQVWLLKPQRKGFALGLGFLALAMGSKEDGILGVTLALWTQIFLYLREERPLPKMRLGGILAMGLCIPLLYYFFRSPHLHTVGTGVSPWNVYAVAQGRNILLHLSTFFLPYPLTLDRDLPAWMNAWQVWLGCWLLLAFFLHMAWRFRSSWITFGFVWALLALLPTHSIVPVLDVQASRILFPMVPAIAFTTEQTLAKYLGRFSKSYVALLGVAFLGLGIMTAHQIQVWQMPLKVWERNAKHAPSRWRTWVNLAVESAEAGQWEKAHRAILQARRLAPDRPEVLYNQAAIYAVRKDGKRSRAKAIFYLRKALAKDPSHPRAQNLLRRLTQRK